MSDPATWALPPLSEAQILGWFDDLCQPAPPGRLSGQSPQAIAMRELADVLARDAYLPRMRQLLESQLAKPLSADAKSRLTTLQVWTQPALVAEGWQDHRHMLEQHIVVGEKETAEGACAADRVRPG